MSLKPKAQSLKINSEEQGIVALMTAIIISILLIVIVLSMIGLMIQEARQASDSNESIVAYYAADAGAEDALLRVKTALNTAGGIAALGTNLSQNTCVSQPPNINNSLYTCQRIILNKNVLTGTLGKEQSLQLDLNGLSGRCGGSGCKLVIKWNASNNGADLNGALFQTGPVWNHPAVMEVAAVGYPTNPTFSTAQIEYGEKIIRPSSTGSPNGFIKTYSLGAVGVPPQTPLIGGCSSPGVDYSCMVTLSGFSSSLNYVLRIRPRYTGTAYQIQYLDHLGNPIDVPDQYATIDVTAKSGTVYRRVIEKVKIKAGALDGLDYVLFSDNDICKDYSVSLGVATGICPP